jgi:DNA-binding NarL/FixJ family response regulator
MQRRREGFLAQRAILKEVTTRQVLARLRSFLARGGTFRQAESVLKSPRSTLSDLACRHNLPRRRRGLDPEKKTALKRRIARGGSSWAIAQDAKVSRRTAWLYQQLSAFRRMEERSRTPLPCAPWRCPVGGELLQLSICVVHGTRKTASDK